MPPTSTDAPAGDATTTASGSYEVHTPVYEGPFDLLLHLILRDQVDLYEITLTEIVDAYLADLAASVADVARELELGGRESLGAEFERPFGARARRAQVCVRRLVVAPNETRPRTRSGRPTASTASPACRRDCKTTTAASMPCIPSPM